MASWAAGLLAQEPAPGNARTLAARQHRRGGRVFLVNRTVVLLRKMAQAHVLDRIACNLLRTSLLARLDLRSSKILLRLHNLLPQYEPIADSVDMPMSSPPPLRLLPGGANPVPGRDFHPQWTSAFSRRT